MAVTWAGPRLLKVFLHIWNVSLDFYCIDAFIVFDLWFHSLDLGWQSRIGSYSDIASLSSEKCCSCLLGLLQLACYCCYFLSSYVCLRGLVTDSSSDLYCPVASSQGLSDCWCHYSDFSDVHSICRCLKTVLTFTNPLCWCRWSRCKHHRLRQAHTCIGRGLASIRRQASDLEALWISFLNCWAA